MGSTFFSPAILGRRRVSERVEDEDFANFLHLTDKFFNVAPYTDGRRSRFDRKKEKEE
jgi:hypothetical protein